MSYGDWPSQGRREPDRRREGSGSSTPTDSMANTQITDSWHGGGSRWRPGDSYSRGGSYRPPRDYGRAHNDGRDWQQDVARTRGPASAESGPSGWGNVRPRWGNGSQRASHGLSAQARPFESRNDPPSDRTPRYNTRSNGPSSGRPFNPTKQPYQPNRGNVPREAAVSAPDYDEKELHYDEDESDVQPPGQDSRTLHARGFRPSHEDAAISGHDAKTWNRNRISNDGNDRHPRNGGFGSFNPSYNNPHSDNMSSLGQQRGEDRMTNSGFRSPPDTRGYATSARGWRPPAGGRNDGWKGAPSPQAGAFSPPPRRRYDEDDFTIPLPPAEYVSISAEPVGHADTTVPKLLVLDLNGALVYRTAHGGGSRKAYPRPFLGCFLDYLFTPEPNGEERGWEAFVWSSAQPHNVRGMVESCFEQKWYQGVWEDESPEDRNERIARGEGRLTGVWARDQMDLGTNYNRKVQTVKDLRKILDHVKGYDLKRVMLLDDSPLKAVLQPWSQIVIPEFDKPEFRESREAAWTLAAAHEESDTNDGSSDEGAPSQRGYSPSNPVHASEEHVASPKPAQDMAFEPGMDNILLAVVGMLEALRKVDNVPAWVRAGGIQNPLDEPAKTDTEVHLGMLPSAEQFTHWFKDSAVRAHWVKCGIAALERKDIPVRHGMTLAGFADGRERGATPSSPMRPGSPGGRSPRVSRHTAGEAGEAGEAPAEGKKRKDKPRWRKARGKGGEEAVERLPAATGAASPQTFPSTATQPLHQGARQLENSTVRDPRPERGRSLDDAE